MAIYALVNLGTGLLSGGFVDSAITTTLPANAVGPITAAQWAAWAANPAGYQWNGTTVVVVATPGFAVTGLSTRIAGCTVHSTGTPAINATYAADPLTMSDLAAKLEYVQINGAFPGGLSSLILQDITGTSHTFGTTTLFKNFVGALISFVTNCQQYDLGNGSLPSSPTVIA